MRRLVAKRSLRRSEGVCVVEGPDLVRAGLEVGAEFEGLYVAANALSGDVDELVSRARDAGVRIFTIEPATFAHIADTKTPQSVMASVRTPSTDLTELAAVRTLVVLHDVQDPGNAGTIVRSADASGASGVIFTGQSVDPYNPKTLRSTAGSIFHVPVVTASWEDFVDWCQRNAVTLVASVAREGIDPRLADLSGSTALVVGNEASGLSAALSTSCQWRVTIPMRGSAESLNAGVAASLLLFEAMFQRERLDNCVPGSSL